MNFFTQKTTNFEIDWRLQSVTPQCEIVRALTDLCRSARLPPKAESSCVSDILTAFFLRHVHLSGGDAIEPHIPYLQKQFETCATRVFTQLSREQLFTLLVVVTANRVWIAPSDIILPRALATVSADNRVAALILLFWTPSTAVALQESAKAVAHESGHKCVAAVRALVIWTWTVRQFNKQIGHIQFLTNN
jgi:hypothetical protein